MSALDIILVAGVASVVADFCYSIYKDRQYKRKMKGVAAEVDLVLLLVKLGVHQPHKSKRSR